MQSNNTTDEQRLGFLEQSYRFKPTDEELMSCLEKKLAGHSIPSDIIPQVDIYKFSPCKLKASYNPSGDDNMFFFSPRNRKFKIGTRPDRRVRDIGYWKASGTRRFKDKNGVVRNKMILNFHVGTPKKSTNTHWIMEEFILEEKSAMTHQNSATASVNPLDKKFHDFCLCKIRYHKTKADKEECQDAQEMEIPNQVPQYRALESESQQNQPYWIMPVHTFNPAITAPSIPAHSTHYMGNCEPITPFLNCEPIDTFNPAVTATSMEFCEFSTPSMPLDTIPATVTSRASPAHSNYYLSNSEPISTPIFNSVDHDSASLLPEPSMEDPAILLSVSTASTSAILSQSQQNQPSMMVPIGTFNPETSTSAPITAITNPAHSTPAAPSVSSSDSGFMLPQWLAVDEQYSTAEDFGGFNFWNSLVNDRSTTEDFDSFELWNWDS